MIRRFRDAAAFLLIGAMLSVGAPVHAGPLCEALPPGLQPVEPLKQPGDLVAALSRHGAAAFRTFEASLVRAPPEPEVLLDFAALALGAGHPVGPAAGDAIAGALEAASWIEAVTLLRPPSDAERLANAALRRRIEAGLLAHLTDQAAPPARRVARIGAALSLLPTSFQARHGDALDAAWSAALRDGGSAEAERLEGVDRALRALLVEDHPFAERAARGAWAALAPPSDLVRLAAAPTPALFARFLTAQAAVDRALAARIAHRQGRIRQARLLAAAALAAAPGRDRAALHARTGALIALGPALAEARAQAEGRRILRATARLAAGAEQVALYDHLLQAATESASLTALGAQAAERMIAAAAAAPGPLARAELLSWGASRAAGTPWAGAAFAAFREVEPPTVAAALYRLGLALEVGKGTWARTELARLCAAGAPADVRAAGRLIERALEREAVLPPVEEWGALDLFAGLQR
ncbi:MAG: hypothetical protein NXI21_15665 [Alphaproteobacteria bacterium]|nr:hypothetical protein [Alphaproteobacteria bacterium]